MLSLAKQLERERTEAKAKPEGPPPDITMS